MYYGTFTVFDYYPKFLAFPEIQVPFRVIKEFCTTDYPKEHRRELKRWRDAVISLRYYSGGRHGPSSLYFTYELTLRFVEAMFLLRLEHKEWLEDAEEITDTQIALEKTKWSYFPEDLSDKEIKNPFHAIKKVFKKLPLPEYRRQTHEWFRYAITSRHSDDDGFKTGDLTIFYENTLKLYSAAWLLYRRSIEEEILLPAEFTKPDNAANTEHS